MRNILEKVRKRDYDAVKAEAQAIYKAGNRKQAEEAFRGSAGAGASRTRRWCIGWSEICRNCCCSLPSPVSVEKAADD